MRQLFASTPLHEQVDAMHDFVQEEFPSIQAIHGGEIGYNATILEESRDEELTMDWDDVRPIRMLLVEDDELTGDALKDMLEERGVVVDLVVSAEEAWERINPDLFDVVVTDIRLPEMSGVGLLGQIRKKMPEFPVILLTGYDSIEPAIEALKLGAQDYILKPIEEPDVVYLPVEKAVSHYRLRQRNRLLEMELIRAEEQERRQLASDLHDSVGQSMAMVKMGLDALAQGVSCVESSDELDGVRKLVVETIKQIRSLIFQVCPPSLYELGLAAALDGLSDHIQEAHGIQVHFDDAGDPAALSHEMQIFMFRAARELVLNAVKHANAKEVRMVLEERRCNVTVEVADDGVGFDIDRKLGDRSASNDGGFGLFAIRRRLKAFGGRIDVASKDGQGTTVTISVPQV